MWLTSQENSFQSGKLFKQRLGQAGSDWVRLGQGFSPVKLLAFQARQFFTMGVYGVYCRGVYQQSSPNTNNKKYFQMLQDVPPLETG